MYDISVRLLNTELLLATLHDYPDKHSIHRQFYHHFVTASSSTAEDPSWDVCVR